MESSPGGRITLRLVPRPPGTGEGDVHYSGTAAEGDASWSVTARIAAEGGAVSVDAGGEPLPAWLAELVRAVLRAAFRAHRAGAPFPRRIHRWRAGPADPAVPPR